MKSPRCSTLVRALKTIDLLSAGWRTEREIADFHGISIKTARREIQAIAEVRAIDDRPSLRECDQEQGGFAILQYRIPKGWRS